MHWLKNGLYPTKVSPWALVWGALLLLLLALLDHLLHHWTIFLVPPFVAMLSILLYLPQQPVAQPLPVILGSTLSAALGGGVAILWHGPLAAAIVGSFLLLALPRAGIYHPPGIALSMYPLLLKPGPWFALAVVLPFTLVAVSTHIALSRLIPGWPPYPRKERHLNPSSD
ncbi:HPP family protein [Sulfobacillus harzensis]|uniref:HPP family protein n=1 Tax=Sulfobacillus harzensis TaxID=2729629 RepID=A0A7Y0Q1X1_9FIRM|nr:HPP family protein [Sulfobacillus harzensis]NMP21887.1 HPP family protein [Sulfobacillus harzensis]